MITAPERSLDRQRWARRAVRFFSGQELPQRNWKARGGNVSLLSDRPAEDSSSPIPYEPGFLQRPISGIYPYLLLETTLLSAGKPTGGLPLTLVVAIGVRSSGQREVLGAEVTAELSAGFWIDYLGNLRQRGLAGVQLVTADDHTGLQVALRAMLPGVAWQRCLTHFMHNATSIVPAPARQFATAVLRRVFAQPDREAACRAAARIARRVARRNPRLAQLLRQADPVCLAYYSFPAEHRQQIWSTNTEPLLHALSRRFALVETSPGPEVALQLAAGVLEQQDAEWRAAGPYCRPVGPSQAEARRETELFRSSSLAPAGRVLVGSAT